MSIAGVRMPCETTTEVGVELVVERRMDVWGDLVVELSRPLATKYELSVGDGRPTHAQRLAASGEPLLIFGGQALVVDNSLSVTPALIVATETAVIAVPSR